MNIERITSSIAYLEGEAFDCSALRTQLDSMVACHEAEQPTERDMLYRMPEAAPTITEHLQSGSNPVFTAGRLHDRRLYPDRRRRVRRIDDTTLKSPTNITLKAETCEHLETLPNAT